MKTNNHLTLTTSPPSHPAGKPRGTATLARRHRFLYGERRRKFTGKERDAETGLYYYGARYLDSRTGRWISGDPAMGEYVPEAPVNDEARKRNQSLPGMGGVFNYVNLHTYHYAGNNPVKYVDPDGEEDVYILYTFTGSLTDKSLKLLERGSMNKHIREMERNGLTVKVIENATSSDVLAAFGDSDALMIYVSGHGNEFEAKIQTSDGSSVIPSNIGRSGPNSSKLELVIFQACYQGDVDKKTEWQKALGSYVEFVGWEGTTSFVGSTSFNGGGTFDRQQKNLASHIKDIILQKRGQTYIEVSG